jgi:hypothetical protein
MYSLAASHFNLKRQEMSSSENAHKFLLDIVGDLAQVAPSQEC